jgi:phosphoglycolate phosphatase-like HAD superfamily hydrolase
MKIKHKYRVHHFMDCYPTEEDALFDICTHLHEKGKLAEEWSDLGIKVAFQTKISEEEVDKLLHSLVLQGYLSSRAGAGKRKYYTVLKHDFENMFL